jgi:hypothetical protein
VGQERERRRCQRLQRKAEELGALEHAANEHVSVKRRGASTGGAPFCGGGNARRRRRRAPSLLLPAGPWLSFFDVMRNTNQRFL